MQRKGEFSTEQAKRFRTERDEQNNVRPEAGYSASEINLDYAVIERLDKSDLTTTLIPFNLGKALKGDDRQNLPLQPGDTIRVFARSDIEIPVANRSVYVRLAGEVNNAGIYRALPGETLRQIVARVGGVTPDAYLFAAELNRESVRQLQQQRLREMADRMEDEVTRNQANRVRSALDQESAGMAQAQAQTGMAIVSRFRQVQARGRVVLEMSPDSSLAKDLPDIVLEDGDVFTVPAKPSVVNVMGMVYSQNSYMYRPDKTVSEYIEQAGGATRDADTSHNYVLRADGSVVSAQNSSAFWGDRFSGGTLMPGDTIVVPEMLDKYALTRELKDWSQILYQFALGAAGIAILF
jgi:protein involved in polysaccharide export with SLBB domain